MLKITYQGVAGAYSHIAAREVFPDAEYLPCETFEIAMEKVQNKEADYAMIPVENSNAGRVSDVHFLLPKMNLFIVDEYYLRVQHQLLGLKGAKLQDIVLASSHPQALAQCSEFLKQHHIQSEARIDTAKSCEDVLRWNDKTKAAIASKLAAEIYGLEILATNIENAHNNTTRFLVLSRDHIIPTFENKKYMTSFIFTVKSIPAALYKALGGFATNGINIHKLESYLVNGKFVSAQFYVEAECHPETQAFKNAFEELRFFSEENSIKILGTYLQKQK